jgi:hypothetical protein
MDRPGSDKVIFWDPKLDLTEHDLRDLVYFTTDEPPEPGSDVVIVEGEKTADAVAAVGFPAVAMLGASARPSDAVIDLLKRFMVTVSPDNDEPGRGLMAHVAGRLERAGLAELRVIDAPPGAPAGWDLADADEEERHRLVVEARELVGFGVFEPEAEPEPGPADDGWPEPLHPAAFHGVLGEVALTVAPYTEADVAGVLGTMLVMFGAACGSGRSLYQGSRQATNLSVLLVGETGMRGRKGTALDVGRAVFRLAYPTLEKLWMVGVASGEAISGHYHRRQEADDTEERVLLVEPEFGRVLTIMSREGSTLSAVLRNAWDGVPLGHARARDERLVTRHHVSVLGHITPVELRSKLTEVDAANGFANRLLILAVRRSRLVPFPTSPDDLVRPFVEPLHRAIVEARTPAELTFDDEARDRWEGFYADLAATPRLGLAGAVTARHEAQVARLALLYAAADRSPAVGVAHLEAAIAVVDYAARSVRWALGDSTGNRDADVLRSMLEDGPVPWDAAYRELGLRRAADMVATVAVLVDAGLAIVTKEGRDGGGRPRRVIRPNGANGANSAGGART